MQIKSIHVTTFQQSTWGRVYVTFEKENQLFYAFKNFIDFVEHNYIGDGELESEPAFSWFEIDKRYTFTKEEVLSGKADNLFLTPDSRKSLYGTPSKLLKRLLIDIYSNNLTPVEKRRGWFKQFYKPTIHLSNIEITKNYDQIVLSDYYSELLLEPLMKTLYILFLKHPEGILRNNISDYKEELTEIYIQITNKSDLNKVNQSIESLIDYSGKSFDEKISKIKKILFDVLGEKLAKYYIVTKSELETYVIKLNSEKISFD